MNYLTVFAPASTLATINTMTKRVWSAVNRQVFITAKDASNTDYLGCNIAVSDTEWSAIQPYMTAALSSIPTLRFYLWNATVIASHDSSLWGQPWSYQQSLDNAGLTLPVTVPLG